ncbi:MAG: DUF3365 domain-containing protein [Glaciecola sp.]|nr:DUF3365 domain-containing protein [Glaciecola sp.]MDG1814635.1 DUF3365 domain-containing protein [Glaciecola sp.]MDG2099052.1 DUF3365 domain-containing protein [Glaciecola sp.]
MDCSVFIRHASIITLCTFGMLTVQGCTAKLYSQETKQALEAEAQLITQRFGGTLKPKLKAAIQSGGLVHAVDICAVEAPVIAQSLSSKTGWEVQRVSLQPRNTETATPDEHERTTLVWFAEQQANQSEAGMLKSSQIVNNTYRYMQAQPVEGVCLNCHGTNIDPAVQSIIESKYPSDMATGYQLGQIRGAFSLAKSLE